MNDGVVICPYCEIKGHHMLIRRKWQQDLLVPPADCLRGFIRGNDCTNNNFQGFDDFYINGGAYYNDSPQQNLNSQNNSQYYGDSRNNFLSPGSDQPGPS